MDQRALEQENLDLAKLQGQVVDLESLRSNYQALLVKKTQVECERDELQKKYSEAVKRVGDMEQVSKVNIIIILFIILGKKTIKLTMERIRI